jgi:hypothetical protein
VDCGVVLMASDRRRSAAAEVSSEVLAGASVVLAAAGASSSAVSSSSSSSSAGGAGGGGARSGGGAWAQLEGIGIKRSDTDRSFYTCRMCSKSQRCDGDGSATNTVNHAVAEHLADVPVELAKTWLVRTHGSITRSLAELEQQKRLKVTLGPFLRAASAASGGSAAAEDTAVERRPAPSSSFLAEAEDGYVGMLDNPDIFHLYGDAEAALDVDLSAQALLRATRHRPQAPRRPRLVRASRRARPPIPTARRAARRAARHRAARRRAAACARSTARRRAPPVTTPATVAARRTRARPGRERLGARSGAS